MNLYMKPDLKPFFKRVLQIIQNAFPYLNRYSSRSYLQFPVSEHPGLVLRKRNKLHKFVLRKRNKLYKFVLRKNADYNGFRGGWIRKHSLKNQIWSDFFWL